MPLTAEEERRIEALMVRMAGELRDRPSQEKEDRVGVEIAALPAVEREFVPTALLRLVAAERDGGELPDPAAAPPPIRRKRWVNPLRFRRAWSEAEAARPATDATAAPGSDASKDAPH